MANNKYTGSQKAAILLLSFGEEISAEIFRHMNEFEIKRVGTAMSRLGRLEQEVVDEVMVEFYDILQKTSKIIYGGSEFTKNLIGTAFEGKDVDSIVESLSLGNSSNLDSLEMIDARTLANFIRNEHPQTIALILAHLNPKKFGDVLKMLPENMHTEIILRVANLDVVAPEIIDEIDSVLRGEIHSMGSIGSSNIGGAESIAEMLNLIDKSNEERILDNLEERDPDLAEQVRLLMFVFDDLVKIDDRGIQELIKAVSNDKWKLALKTSSEAVKDLIFRNMSERAAGILKDDMEAMGAVRISDIEAAQSEIIQVARKLEAEGKIVIMSGESAYV